MPSASNPFVYAVAGLALLSSGCASSPISSHSASRASLILISIDGLRPEFYHSQSGWEAPTLRHLAALGAVAESAEPIYPSLTYPSHTTLVTGVRSQHHGVYSNTIFTLKDGSTPMWYWDAEYVQSPTIWQRARAAGYKTAILTWPGTVGAQSDWLIPEIFAAPPQLNGSTWELMHKYMNAALADELLAVNSGAIPDGFALRDAWVTHAAEYILREKHPDFSLLHIINVDHAEHESGKDSPEAHQALREADEQLSRVLSSVDLKQTTVIVLGDHGFYDYNKVFRPNVLFAHQGWLHEEKLAGAPQPTIAKNWKVLAHPDGGATAIYSRDPKLTPRILAVLKKNAGHAYRVLERAELDLLEAFPGAICALDPITHSPEGPGYSVNTDAHGAFIEKLPKTRGNHGPLPASDSGLLTGFLAAGPGIEAGTRLGHIRLIDVAPTIAKILDVPLSETEGQAIDLRGKL